jgi:hypothetical protein
MSSTQGILKNDKAKGKKKIIRRLYDEDQDAIRKRREEENKTGNFANIQI